MPAKKSGFKHLRRLERTWVEPEIYFVTTCTANRVAALANARAHEVLRSQFANSPTRYGWTVGRYVVMPDHLHFFCAPGGEREPASLSDFIGGLKSWSARLILAERGRALWQREFFDHLLRSQESYEAKWAYVRENPVRAGLAATAELWPYAGEIETLEL